MRLLIDATSVLLRSAGVKNYTYRWIEHLRLLARNEQIRAFPFLDHLGPLTHERSNLTAWATYRRIAALHLANAGAVDWFTKDADIFHMSNQVRRVPRKPKITATVHDLTCWLMPELHTAGNIKADRNFAGQVLKRADRLIAVSENTRQDAIRLLGIGPERIEVIYSGVAEVFFDAQPAPAERPYALFVGAIEPRKNLTVLLDAWQSSRLYQDFDLRIAGPPGWSSRDTMARLAARPAGVQYLGYVAEDELPGLTAGAAVFVYPSLYEGFGFPVAQAMAAAVPVVTSNVSCLPEITGGGGIFVDPHSSEELASALKRLFADQALRQQYGRAGRQQAERYRWEQCARQSLAFFNKVMS
jgi:glycosyltransferase involved in cell wall biosynthesis